MVAVPVVRHGQREPLLPAEPEAPAVPDALPEAEPPALEPDDPAPVSVLTLPLSDPDVVVVVVEGDVVDAVVDVVSVDDGVVAVVAAGVVVVVTVEPGVALAPELLLAVSTPRLQPARPAVARAMTAM